MNGHRARQSSWAIAAALALTVGPALAAPLQVPAEQREGTVRFINGGVGRAEQLAIYRVAKRYPLHITLSERKDGEFLADVPVVIKNEHGNPVFRLAKAGPLLDVRLPAGKYRVTAKFDGKSETQDVTVDNTSERNLYFHWKGQANT